MTTVWTLGHSTRAIEAFLAALASFGVQTLVDVRRYPTSRRNPHFGAVDLKKSLFGAGVAYRYLGDELGGMRPARTGSPHACLKGGGFQGYADWMEGATFRAGIDRLLGEAEAAPTAIMCAERPPSACHRSLAGDFLVLVRGVDVWHIADVGDAAAHRLTTGVRRGEEGLVYDVPSGARPLGAFDGPTR